jgi:hypothetical protein
MFRTSMCPSSGEITLSMRHWYLSLCMGGVWSAGWSFTPTSRPDDTHTEWQIPVLHRYSNFSWWWAHGYPKHVEKINKYTKQNCASSWIYMQDCTRMHSQQNIKNIKKKSYVLSEPVSNKRIVHIAWVIRFNKRRVGVAARYRLGGPGIASRQGWDFLHPSIPPLELTHPPIWWMPFVFRG